MMLWWALNEATASELPLPRSPTCPSGQRAGQELSKRRDPVAVEMYASRATSLRLPQLPRPPGLEPGGGGDRPLATLIDRFRIGDVQRSPAFFDIKKLTHMNGVYIRALATPEFIELSLPWVHPSRVPGPPATGAIRYRDDDYRGATVAAGSLRP